MFGTLPDVHLGVIDYDPILPNLAGWLSSRYQNYATNSKEWPFEKNGHQSRVKSSSNFTVKAFKGTFPCIVLSSFFVFDKGNNIAMKKFVFVLSALSLSLSVLAVDAVGKYNGKISVDLSSVKKMVKDKAAKATPDQKKQAEQILSVIDAQQKSMNAAVLKLELKKDGTLTLQQTMGGKKENETGKWSAKGNTIKISNLNGKGNGPKEMTGTISKDGKTLFFDLTKEIQKQGPQTAKATASITFKKG